MEQLRLAVAPLHTVEAELPQTAYTAVSNCVLETIRLFSPSDQRRALIEVCEWLSTLISEQSHDGSVMPSADRHLRACARSFLLCAASQESTSECAFRQFWDSEGRDLGRSLLLFPPLFLALRLDAEHSDRNVLLSICDRISTALLTTKSAAGSHLDLLPPNSLGCQFLMLIRDQWRRRLESFRVSADSATEDFDICMDLDQYVTSCERDSNDSANDSAKNGTEDTLWSGSFLACLSTALLAARCATLDEDGTWKRAIWPLVAELAALGDDVALHVLPHLLRTYREQGAQLCSEEYAEKAISAYNAITKSLPGPNSVVSLSRAIPTLLREPFSLVLDLPQATGLLHLVHAGLQDKKYSNVKRWKSILGEVIAFFRRTGQAQAARHCATFLDIFEALDGGLHLLKPLWRKIRFLLECDWDVEHRWPQLLLKRGLDSTSVATRRYVLRSILMLPRASVEHVSMEFICEHLFTCLRLAYWYKHDIRDLTLLQLEFFFENRFQSPKDVQHLIRELNGQKWHDVRSAPVMVKAMLVGCSFSSADSALSILSYLEECGKLNTVLFRYLQAQLFAYAPRILSVHGANWECVRAVLCLMPSHTTLEDFKEWITPNTVIDGLSQDIMHYSKSAESDRSMEVRMGAIVRQIDHKNTAVLVQRMTEHLYRNGGACSKEIETVARCLAVIGVQFPWHDLSVNEVQYSSDVLALCEKSTNRRAIAVLTQFGSSNDSTGIRCEQRSNCRTGLSTALLRLFELNASNKLGNVRDVTEELDSLSYILCALRRVAKFPLEWCDTLSSSAAIKCLQTTVDGLIQEKKGESTGKAQKEDFKLLLATRLQFTHQLIACWSVAGIFIPTSVLRYLPSLLSRYLSTETGALLSDVLDIWRLSMPQIRQQLGDSFGSARGKSPKTVSDIRSFSPMLPVVEAAASACFHQPSKLLQFKAAALLTSPLLLSNRTVATCVHAWMTGYLEQYNKSSSGSVDGITSLMAYNLSQACAQSPSVKNQALEQLLQWSRFGRTVDLPFTCWENGLLVDFTPNTDVGGRSYHLPIEEAFGPLRVLRVVLQAVSRYDQYSGDVQHENRLFLLQFATKLLCFSREDGARQHFHMNDATGIRRMRNYQALAALLVARDKDGRSSFLRILWGVEEHSSQEWKDVFQQAVTMISLHNHRTTRQYLEVFLAEMIVQDVDRAAREKKEDINSLPSVQSLLLHLEDYNAPSEETVSFLLVSLHIFKGASRLAQAHPEEAKIHRIKEVLLKIWRKGFHFLSTRHRSIQAAAIQLLCDVPQCSIVPEICVPIAEDVSSFWSGRMALFQGEALKKDVPDMSAVKMRKTSSFYDLLDIFCGIPALNVEWNHNAIPDYMIPSTDFVKYCLSDDLHWAGATNAEIASNNLPVEETSSVYWPEDDGNISFQQKITPWDEKSAGSTLMDEPDDNERTKMEKVLAKKRAGGLIVVASLLEKMPNFGGLCRTCEIFGVAWLVLPDKKILKDSTFLSMSVSAESWINLQFVPPPHLPSFLQAHREQGYALVGLEQTSDSFPLEEFVFPPKTVLVLGNEKRGIPTDIIDMLDHCVEIPQSGIIRSLNVHVSSSICIYKYASQHTAVAPLSLVGSALV